jgi:hypothetical protein
MNNKNNKKLTSISFVDEQPSTTVLAGTGTSS